MSSSTQTVAKSNTTEIFPQGVPDAVLNAYMKIRTERLNTRLAANVLRTEFYESNVDPSDHPGYKEFCLRESYSAFPDPVSDKHHERYLAIQKAREAEKPKESYAEKEKRLLDSNTKQQERVKREIARVEEEIAKKTPGTLRDLKKYLKELQEELRTIKICRGTLYNGGIW